MGNQKFTIALHSVCILMLILLYETEGSSTRQKYGGRVLNIAPTICKSARFPKITGTCMISLECQQRSGTVIGACRDGVLFGACCHEPLEAQTLPPALLEAATDLPAELIRNVVSFDDNNAADSTKNEILEVETTVPPKEPTVVADLEVKATPEDLPTERVSAVPNEIHEHATDKTESVTELPQRTSGPAISNSLREELQRIADITTDTHTTKAPLSPTTESIRETTSIKSDLKIAEPTQTTLKSVPTSTTSTTPTPTTSKLSFSRINFSPKPFKPRVTTVKTIWTRPPTTEASYVVFKTSEEEDDNDDEGETYSRSSPKTPSTPTESVSNTFGSGSVEKTTISPKSVEQTTTISVKQTEVPTESTTRTTPSPVITRMPVEQSSTEPETTTAAVSISSAVPVVSNKANDTSTAPSVFAKDSNETIEEGRSSSSLKKQSRIENDLDSDDDSQDSSSSSLDHKLDDFVNQVVDGIAVELNKSNIDDVVFKSTTTTTEPSTTKRVKSTPKAKVTTKDRKKPTNPKATIGKGNKGPSKGKAANKGKGKEAIKRVATKVEEVKADKPVKHAKSKKKPTKKVVTTKVTDSNDTSIVLDYRKDCGVRPFFRQGRIVGGTPSAHGSWPWHALVKETVWWGLFSKIKCGGVLIGSRHVLTAAHCQPQPTGKLSVVLGVTDSDNPSSNSVTKAVRRIIKHPQFNPRSYENDIAIIELESPVEFHPHIVPICLPERSETFEGKKGFVTGMGLLKHDGERPLVLHEVDVPIVNNTECQSMFRRSGNAKPIKSSFICAGYPQGLKDSCGGDSGSYRISSSEFEGIDFTLMNETDFFSSSGGPLSVQRENGQWVLAGTVSHGIKCAVPNQPGVYMRTTWFQPWIEKVTRSARGRAAAPRCPGPPGSCDHRGRSGGILDTLFRVLRLARKMWQSRK